jgi:hypothetical protein
LRPAAKPRIQLGPTSDSGHMLADCRNGCIGAPGDLRVTETRTSFRRFVPVPVLCAPLFSAPSACGALSHRLRDDRGCSQRSAVRPQEARYWPQGTDGTTGVALAHSALKLAVAKINRCWQRRASVRRTARLIRFPVFPVIGLVECTLRVRHGVHPSSET